MVLVKGEVIEMFSYEELNFKDLVVVIEFKEGIEVLVLKGLEKKEK